MECLEGSLLKLMPNIKSGTSRTITNIVKKEYTFYGKLRQELLHRCTLRILLIDTEHFSKILISLQVFFKNFANRFQNNYKSKN